MGSIEGVTQKIVTSDNPKERKMEKTIMSLAILLSIFIAVNASHAGWVKDFSRSAGKATRTITNKGKSGYAKGQKVRSQ